MNGSRNGGVGSGVSGSGVINVRAGSFIRIDLQICGSPVPTVTWLKDHQPILLGNRVRQSARISHSTKAAANYDF